MLFLSVVLKETTGSSNFVDLTQCAESEPHQMYLTIRCIKHPKLLKAVKKLCETLNIFKK